MKNVLWLKNVDSNDISKVGAEAAYLGEIKNNTNVPTISGFTTTKEAYNAFLRETNLRDKIETLLHDLNLNNVGNLQRAGRQIRGHIKEADIPEDLRKEFIKEYERLESELGIEKPSVRLSCSTAAGASMIGESYLKVSGKQQLINRIKDCYASIFTNSAISYREENGISHFDVEPSVVVQEMVCSNPAASGTINTTDPNSGTDNIASINGGYGFEDHVKQRRIEPDNFKVFKENLGIIEKNIGEKKLKLVKEEGEDNHNDRVVSKRVPMNDRERFCITENQVKELSKYGLDIEEHCGRPMNIEWVLDNQTKQLFIIGATPAAADQADKGNKVVEDHKLQEESQVLLQGKPISNRIKSGAVRILSSPKQIDQFEEGEILVVDTTCPDWEPVMKKAGAIITNRASRHTKEVCKEKSITSIVGTENASSQLSDGQKVTVDCSGPTGKIWEEELEFISQEYEIDEIPETETNIQIEIDDPSEAFRAAQKPVSGAAKADLSSIMLSEIEEHPLNLIRQDKEDEYIEAVRSSVGKIGAAFYPDEVIICLSNFTEDSEADVTSNPGHQSNVFQKAFELECKAIRKVIDELRLDNIAVMIPICRTVKEGNSARARMKEHGLDQGDINVYLRAETPSNVVRGEEFAKIFDGFSIETDKLSQLTLGIDRKIDKIGIHNGKNPSVKKSVESLIKKAHEKGKTVDICGFNSSTDEEYLEFLIKNRVDSVSVSPDLVLETISKIAEVEEYGDIESADFLVSSKAEIGTAAGQIYELLNENGKSTVEILKQSSMTSLDSGIVHQALGWLAKEGKVDLEVKKNGEVKYHLD